VGAIRGGGPARGDSFWCHRRLRPIFSEEKESAAPTTASPAEELLSRRQRQVARRAADGCSAAEIAQGLGVAQETVRVHLRAIYRRLGVQNRIQLRALLREPAA
jgi:DNA-binding NarL/FixJ family response regulator